MSAPIGGDKSRGFKGENSVLIDSSPREDIAIENSTLELQPLTRAARRFKA
jgi:hypothetical protein